MGFLSSIPLMAMGNGVLGITVSILLAVILLALWALVLLILHPLHATMFVITVLFEYALIALFGFHIWVDVIAFFVFYITIFALYSLFLRRFIPMPKNEIEMLIKLSELRRTEQLSEEEFKAAKKRLLKI
ncbi:MAG: hypothetical protein IJ738_01985 [Alphaproteobacteria bacterium]|nr:hypothetical protein [Alphaproteobacteria bacterium]